MKNLYKKLLAFQNEVGAIQKDSENPFYHSTYFDINKIIEEIKPILNKNGLIVAQPLTHLNGNLALQTMIIDAESGEELVNINPIPDAIDPQKLGSAITYFRRYALQSLLFLQAEDDDANNASDKTIDKKYEEDPRPWLTENQLYSMLKFIDEGRADVVRDKMVEYRMKKQYREQLEEALKSNGIKN